MARFHHVTMFQGEIEIKKTVGAETANSNWTFDL